MVKIYVNSLIPSEDLTVDTFTDAFDSYVTKLKKLTTLFKNFSKFIKENDIQISDADGFANSGTFEVDEIDAERLKKAGLVIDYSEIEEEPEIPAFYIDAELDEVLKNTAESIENGQHIINLPGPMKVELEFPAIPENIEEETLTFNLSEILNPDIELEGDLKPGHMVLQVFPQDDNTHKFNLIMLDFYSDPAEFNLDRERMVFCYKEKDDEEWREKPIKEVFHSLKTANALLSNIVIMVRDDPYLFETLGSLDQDLRFLQQWLAFDYALDEGHDDTDAPEGDDSSFEV